jgi:hypothetical protein
MSSQISMKFFWSHFIAKLLFILIPSNHISKNFMKICYEVNLTLLTNNFYKKINVYVNCSVGMFYFKYENQF